MYAMHERKTIWRNRCCCLKQLTRSQEAMMYHVRAAMSESQFREYAARWGRTQGNTNKSATHTTIRGNSRIVEQFSVS